MKNRTYSLGVVVLSLVLLGGLIGLIYHNRQPASVLTEVTTDTFADQVVNSTTPVYVEFYTRTSKACAKQAPVLEKLAPEYQGKVKFVRIDAEKNIEVTMALGIDTVPTHLLVRPADKVVVGAVGVLDEAGVRKFIDGGLKAKPEDKPDKPGADTTDHNNGSDKGHQQGAQPMEKTNGLPNLQQPFMHPLR